MQFERDARREDSASKALRARIALSGVGHDRDAEDVWIALINDPDVSGDARHDLIEDLNEDGLSNSRDLSRNDLPVIYRRIDLIDELAPDAMDKINSDAFAEARKDLVNMVARLTGR